MLDNPQTRRELIDKAVEIAVLASQQGSVQEFAARLTSGLLDSQKQFAVDYVIKYLKQFGLEIDPEIVEGLVNAQVLRLRMQTLQAKRQ